MSKTRNLSNSAPQFNALIVPTGTTAQRPSVVPGYIRFNTDLNTLESANSTAWANVGSGSVSSSSGSGGVAWQGVVNSNTNVTVGNAYPVNTTLGPVVITLPVNPQVGNIIQLTDYARTWNSNTVTLNPNGNKIQANTANAILNINGQSVSLVYIDSIQGWITVVNSTTQLANYTVSYLSVAGGGGGASGGGGAGGLLFGTYSVSAGQTYPITVGGGGSAGAGSGGPKGTNGGNSSFSSIAVSVGGGGASSTDSTGLNGGSGGGAGANGGAVLSGGSGTAGQGNNGGSNGSTPSPYPAGGGGGAAAVGANGSGSNGGNGGSGAAYSISGSSTTYAGGGGGGVYFSATAGSGGSGGGGNGSTNTGTASNGGTNLGGGGGGSGNGGTGGSGGSGVVIVSYAGSQRASGGTVTTVGGNTIHIFNSSGTFTA